MVGGWILPVVLAFAGAGLGFAGSALLLSTRRRSGAAGGTAVRGLRALATVGAVLRRGRPLDAPRDLPARIDAAGRPGGLGAAELMTAKLASAVAAAVTGAVLSAAAPGRLGLLLAVASPVAGFLAPDLWLVRRAAERARRVRRDLPAMLDLLRVTTQAGGSLPAALHAVGERASGPLAAEWRAVSREVSLGVPLREALASMAGRLPLPEVRALVAALDRATRYGAPLAETLAAQSRGARFGLRRRVREEAARAGPKIQLVVALLLVPSVLLLVAAALAAALLDSGGAGAVLGP